MDHLSEVTQKGAEVRTLDTVDLRDVQLIEPYYRVSFEGALKRVK